MKKSDLLEAVAEMNTDELNDLVEVIKIRRRHISDRKKVTFSHGDKVRFNGQKRHGVLTGEIVKRNPKRAKVRTKVGVYNVPYTMLEHV